MDNMIKRIFSLQNVLILVLAVIVYYGISWLGLPWYLFPVVLIGSTFLVLLAYYLYMRFVKMRPFFPLQRAFKRFEKGEIETVTVIEEITARRAGGVRSAVDSIILAGGYGRLGRGEEAEKAALDAMDMLEQDGTSRHKNLINRWMYDTAVLALCDALAIQGRYDEAARIVQGRVAYTRHPNYMALVTAWEFFLGGDTYNAAAALKHVQPVNRQQAVATWIVPRFLPICAYLRHKLLGEDTLAELKKHRKPLAEWDQIVQRQAGNTYGARLREVLDDIQRLIA